jgi:hypothetical protein
LSMKANELMRVLRQVALISLVVALGAGCSSRPVVLPDRTDPEVKAEEARIATMLISGWHLLGEPSDCKVRLLGQKAKASFVWATCDARDSSSSASMPLRVIGPKVNKPGDGAAFSDTVRELFPADLAEYVIANQDSPSLRP